MFTARRLAVVAAASVVLASVAPVSGVAASAGPLALDALFHAVGYGVVAALVVRSRGPTAGGFVVAVVAAVALGVAVEGLQALLPFRTASVGDVVADLAGAVVGAAAAVALGRKHRPSE